jgi:enolase-phosphatase E1
MPPTAQPTAILTDIEGTTTPIAFVRDELFPYARMHLSEFLRAHAARPDVAAALAEAADLAGDQPVLQALLGWMDQDAKITPLKTLQGLIWDDGYRQGRLTGRIYPDVPPVLRRWHEAGLRLYVYSSGSKAAQRLIFSHSDAGDLEPLFGGFFDTTTGPKRAADSYRMIARATGLPPEEFLFLSDIEQELDAAAEAGMGVCQLVRPQDGTHASARHKTAPDFPAVGALIR